LRAGQAALARGKWLAASFRLLFGVALLGAAPWHGHEPGGMRQARQAEEAGQGAYRPKDPDHRGFVSLA
jgi:hypothetical protein